MPWVHSSSSSSCAAVPGLARLLGGDLRAEHHVAEQRRVGGGSSSPAAGVGPQLVHGEGQHVGRARLAHPLLVQLGHRRLVDHQRSTARPAGGCPSGRARGRPARPALDSSTSTPDSLTTSMLTGSPRPPGRASPPAAAAACRSRAAPTPPRRRSGRRRRRCRSTSLCRTTSCAGQPAEVDVVDAVEDVLDDPQAALRAAGQVDLGDVAGDHDLGAEAEPGQEHLHLLGRGVLRLVEDDEGVVERAAAHVGQRRDLDRARRPSAAGSSRGRACRAARRTAAAGRGRSSRRACRAGSRAARPPRRRGGSG